MKNDIHNGLFGFLATMTDDALRKRTRNLVKELTAKTSNNTAKKTPIKKMKPKAKGTVKPKIREPKLLLTDIENMDVTERQDLMNKLIEKGPKRLSPYDKKLLKKLASSLR